MKKVLFSIVLGCFALIIGLTAFGCGGGGGKKSGLKSNQYLGALPALHADYELAEEASEAKIDKARAKGDLKKYMKVKEEEDKAWDERQEKFEAAKKAEWDKLDGKEIPYTVSDAFSQLDVQVGTVKLIAESQKFHIPVTAKKDFTVSNLRNRYDYETIYYRFLAKDGSVLGQGGMFLIFLGFSNSISIKEGENIQFNDSDITGFFPIDEPEKWVDFASLEFITREEFME